MCSHLIYLLSEGVKKKTEGRFINTFCVPLLELIVLFGSLSLNFYLMVKRLYFEIFARSGSPFSVTNSRWLKIRSS